MTTLLIVYAILSRPLFAAPMQDPMTRALEKIRLTQQAGEMYNAGRYDEAISLAERAGALEAVNDPEIGIKYSLSSPHSILARAYHAKGDYVRAEAAFQRLITLY